MPRKASAKHNRYDCCVELNQGGKYCVRIRAQFKNPDWVLPVYFLASTFERATRKLEQSVDFLQRSGERLWFWGVDRSDDPNVAAEMLREVGLHLDRRAEFPGRSERLDVGLEQSVPPYQLQALRRRLEASIEA